MNSRNLYIAIALSAWSFAGCETPQSTQTPPPPHVMRCKVPEITAMPETKQSQEKGGIEISIAPAAYEAKSQTRKTRQRAQPPFLWIDPAPQTGEKVFFDEITTPYLVAAPERLQYTVKINNKLDRVFRGAGTVVSYNVGGKLLAVDQTGYGEMLGAIVPPRSEYQLTIFGPKIDTIPDTGTLGVFFYDVVTKVDAAGTVTEKQNYEWYFKYEAKLVERPGEVTKQRMYMPASGWQQ